jgi:hypothetical protein
VLAGRKLSYLLYNLMGVVEKRSAIFKLGRRHVPALIRAGIMCLPPSSPIAASTCVGFSASICHSFDDTPLKGAIFEVFQEEC